MLKTVVSHQNQFLFDSSSFDIKLRTWCIHMDFPVYCYMDGDDLGQCGGGGWTMVLKIDGSKVHLKRLRCKQIVQT